MLEHWSAEGTMSTLNMPPAPLPSTSSLLLAVTLIMPYV